MPYVFKSHHTSHDAPLVKESNFLKEFYSTENKVLKEHRDHPLLSDMHWKKNNIPTLQISPRAPSPRDDDGELRFLQLLTSRIEELRGQIHDYSRSPRRLDPLSNSAPIQPKNAWQSPRSSPRASPTSIQATAIPPLEKPKLVPTQPIQQEPRYPQESPRKRRNVAPIITEPNYNPHQEFSTSGPPRVSTRFNNQYAPVPPITPRDFGYLSSRYQSPTRATKYGSLTNSVDAYRFWLYPAYT